jgi:hypothetical protein
MGDLDSLIDGLDSAVPSKKSSSTSGRRSRPARSYGGASASTRRGASRASLYSASRRRSTGTGTSLLHHVRVRLMLATLLPETTRMKKMTNMLLDFMMTVMIP